MRIYMKQEEVRKGTGQRQRHIQTETNTIQTETNTHSFVGPRSAAASGQIPGESSNNHHGSLHDVRCTHACQGVTEERKVKKVKKWVKNGQR